MPVLLCDLDDTLFDHDRATRDSLADLRRSHQVLTCWSLDELDARHRALLETLHVDVLAGRLVIDDARRERFSRLLAQAGVEDAAAAEEMACRYRTTYAANWHPVPGALELLRAVRAEGHSVVIVTNNNAAEQQLKLERCDIGSCVDVMVTSETGRIVRAALAELPVEQRQTLELAYFRGLSQSEIAEKTGQPLGTIKTRVRLAMAKLREKLGSLQEARP